MACPLKSVQASLDQEYEGSNPAWPPTKPRGYGTGRSPFFACPSPGLWEEDLERTEEEGCIAGADAGRISEKAIDRGYKQIGTLGSGNHYLEIQVAHRENVFDAELAKAFGIVLPDQVVIMFHDGRRFFNYVAGRAELEAFPAEGTELVFIGPKVGRDREAIEGLLHSCEGR